MKGSAQFYADLLIEEPKHHYLVIAPANSPENHF
jgi:alpha-L-fucosidase 2